MNRPSCVLEHFLIRGDIDACRNRLARIHDALNGNVFREAAVRFHFGDACTAKASPERASRLVAERDRLVIRLAELEQQAGMVTRRAA